jgi:DNA end-binding protein Ku
MELAKRLVSALAGPFDPGQFRDTHGERLREAVQGKVEAEAQAARKAAMSGKAAGADRKVIDLMERLQRSLGGEDWSAAPAPKARSGKAGGAKARAKAPARGADEDHGPERQYRKRKAG